MRLGIEKKWDKVRRAKRQSAEPQDFKVLPYVRKEFNPKKAMENTITDLIRSINQNRDGGYRLTDWAPFDRYDRIQGGGEDTYRDSYE